MKATTDVVVIGAGVVGCAIARALRPELAVTVVERHAQPGQETSSRNSGVIHSGIHLPPASTKAVLARRGKALLIEFCREHPVRLERVGMHIVVSNQDLLGLWPETRRLVQMLSRAHSQNIQIEVATGWSIRRREPFIQGLFGLRIPDVYIIDAAQLVSALHTASLTVDGSFHFSQEVVALEPSDLGWRVITPELEIDSRCVINAAGLYADQVAGLAGFSHRQFFYRGEYYRIRPESGIHLNGLVYPVHQPGKPGLGVHLTRTIDGKMLIGPNAKRVTGPTDYTTNPTPAIDFYQDVLRFLPDLKLNDLVPHPAGIRPKLSDAPGENDFQIQWESGSAPFLNLIGIESPGLTAALAIAEHVSRNCRTRLLDAPH